jgi:hypothetical protein
MEGKRWRIHAAWVGAIFVAQERGDLSPLLKLLHSPQMKMRMGERKILADFLSRRARIVGTPAAKKGGRPRRKLFTMTAERRLKTAAEFVHRIRQDFRLPKNMSVADFLRWHKQHSGETLVVEDGRVPTQAEAIEWYLTQWPDETEWLSSKGEPGGKLALYLEGRRGATRRQRRRQSL